MQILKRLFLLLAPYWKTIIISAVLLVGRAGLELVPPLFQREIIDEVITAFNLKYLGILIAALVGAYGLSQLVQIGDKPIDRANWDWGQIRQNPFFCPDADAAAGWERRRGPRPSGE